VERLQEIFQQTKQLSSDLVTVHLGSYVPGSSRQEALERVVGALREVCKLAESLRIRICVENFTTCHGETDMAEKTEDFVFLFEKVNSPAIGLNLDTGHANVAGNLFELVKLFGPRVYNTHLHDTDGLTDGHLPPGEGTIPWDKFLSALRDVSYTGLLNFEFPEASGKYSSFIKKIHSL